jgi:plastocyanin
MTVRALLLVCVLTCIGVTVAACGGSGGGYETGPEPTPAASLSLKVKDIKFDKKSLAAPAGAQVSMSFDNEDGGAQHNFSLYEDKGGKKSLYKGELFPGKKTVTYTFTAPSAGTYYYRCDAHPDMVGTFYAK